jgi:glycosyltransferase involved in cell wall biosynthesis
VGNSEFTSQELPEGPQGLLQAPGAPWVADMGAGLPAGILFLAAVYGGTGYSTEGWAEAVGLAQSQIPMQLVPLGPQDDSRRLLPVPVRNTLENLKLPKLDLARSVVYQHTTADAFNLNLYGRCRVGRTMFESDRIPDGWADRCNAMDEVWVPTEFNRETFTFSGVDEDRLRVLPIGIDSSLFRPGHERFPWPQARGFRFLSNFDWLDRKGMKVLLKSYLDEFKPDEDVCLVLKISQHGNRMAEAEAQLAYFVEREAGLSLEKSPPIILVKGSIPHLEMPRLYASADAYVLASHGEGFGLPYIEALACGLPVIATRWSGQLDFLHDGNSYLIEVEGLVPASPEVEYYAGHRWAQPSVDHLRQLMRTVFSHPEDARGRAALGRQEITEHWDWDVVLKRWAAEFRRLLNQ